MGGMPGGMMGGMPGGMTAGCVPPMCGGFVLPTFSSIDVTYLYSFAGATVRGTAPNIPLPSAATGFASIPAIGAPVGGQIDFGIDPATGMAWGRWQAGWASMDPGQGAMPTSLHFFTVPTQTVAINLPITGTFNYTRVGNTTPTDNSGNQGALTTATFSADFTNQRVNVSVGTTMPKGNNNVATPTVVGATANNLALGAGGSFNTAAPVMSCSGSCGALSGTVGGQLTANPTALGAGVGYGLTNGNQIINGTAVFSSPRP